MKLKALLICLLLPTLARSMDTVSKIVKPSGVFAASWLTVLISHEAGHALVGKLLFNEPINIHLASDPTFNVTDPLMLKIGPFQLHGMPLFGAVPGMSIQRPVTKKEAIMNRLKMIVFNAAGPAMGTSIGILLNYLANAAGVSTQIPFYISMINLLNLLPISTKGFISDGYSIWQDIKHLKYLLTARKTIYDVT